MKPTAHKTTWQVYTSSETYNQTVLMGTGGWAWVAHGPRGSDAGVEGSASVALDKARAAAMLLSDPAEPR